MPVDLEEIKQMVEAGMTVSAIAEEVGVTSARISQLVGALGLSDQVVRKSTLTRLGQEDIDNILSMYENGETVTRIIAQYKLSYNAFYKLLAREGIELRNRVSGGEDSSAGPSDRELRVKRVDLAVKMYEQGVKLTKIEMETGIRQPELHRVLAIRGIPLRRNKLKLTRSMMSEDDDEDDLIAMLDLTPEEQEILDGSAAKIDVRDRSEMSERSGGGEGYNPGLEQLRELAAAENRMMHPPKKKPKRRI